MAYRRPSTAVSAAGLNINDLRALLKLDIVASNELDAKIDLFRQDIKNGRNPPEQRIDEMDVTNKDMTKDVVRNIEKIESQGPPSKLTTTDREVLQALHARLATCDKQAMRLVELRDLLNEEKRKRQKEAPLPLGGKPRTPDNSPSPRKVTEQLRHATVPAPVRRPDSPGPILERVNSRDLPGPPPGRRSSEAGFNKSYTSTPSPRFAEYPAPPSPRNIGRVFPPPDFPPPVGPAAAQSPRRSSESFFNRASSSAAPPSPRRSGSGRFFEKDITASPSSSRSDLAGSAGTPSPRRSPRVDTPQSEQLKYEDFYFVNGVDGDIEPDKTTWPIIYRIMDVDPSTDPRVFDGALKR